MFSEALSIINVHMSSLQSYSVLSGIWVKIELCIPLESESSVLSTGYAFVCLSPPSKLKFAVLFCSICIWVKIVLCIPLESESSVLSTGNAFVCISPPSKLKSTVLFCSICKGLISFSATLFYVIFIQWKMMINVT